MTHLNVPYTSISIAGALHVDEVATVQGPFIPAASNAVLWQRSIGGVAANVARAAKRVCDNHATAHDVSLHCVLGDDSAGKSVANRITKLGIVLNARYAEGLKTGRYSVIVDEFGELLMGLADVSIAECLEAKQIFSSIEADSLKARQTGMLFMDANLTKSCIDTVIRQARHQSIPISAVCVSPVKALKLVQHSRQIDLVFCNRREAFAMAIHANLIPASARVEGISAQELADLLDTIGFASYVLTNENHPVVVCDNGQRFQLDIPAINVSHNVNGAGDALAGATLAAILIGNSLAEAVSDYGLPMAADVLTGKHLPLSLD